LEFKAIPKGDKCEGFDLIIYREELINEMLKLYSKEATRYYRSKYEFINLLKGATTSWGNFTYQTYPAKHNEEYSAYAVVRIINEEEKRGTLVECAGDRGVVLKMLTEIAMKNGLKHILVQIPQSDPMKQVLINNDLEVDFINTEGTIKIMNFKALMNKLNVYFKQYVEEEIVDNLIYEVDGVTFNISLGNESLQINNMLELVNLVFIGKLREEININDIPILASFIKAVFPIPFVWTGNLNYQ
jgi:hypothetical protein